jgi:hypothetical protein
MAGASRGPVRTLRDGVMEVTTYLLADVATKRRFRSLATHADGDATRFGMAIADRQDDFGVARPTLSGCADDCQGWVLLGNHLAHDPPGLQKDNYPFSSGRNLGQPDPNEFIILKLDRPLSRPQE